MNCISHTGRMPMWAAPAAAPTIAASESGVSMTRCSPKRACRPSVTLNAPPYAPMSSPRQKTFGVPLHLLEQPLPDRPRGRCSQPSCVPQLAGRS